MRASATIQVVLLGLFMVVARADPPVNDDDYRDDKLLAKATQEIAQMNSDQLGAFIEYVSSCRAFDVPMNNRLHCSVALKRSEIKNSSADSVLRIARVLEFHTQGIINRSSKSRVPVPTKRHVDMSDSEVDRFRDIFEAFKLAAAARYAQLSVPASR